jgi:hypothetical protein
VPSAALGPAAPNDMPHWPRPGDESSHRPDMLIGAALGGEGDAPGMSKPVMRSPLQPAKVAAIINARARGGRGTPGPGSGLKWSLKRPNVIGCEPLPCCQSNRAGVPPNSLTKNCEAFGQEEIMTRMIVGHNRVKRWLGLTATALLIALAPPHRPAQAQADAIAPVEDFSRELNELKKTFTDLGQRIDEGAKSIDGLTDVQRARKEIEELRAAAGSLLGAVADNGEVSQLGAKALDRAQDKIRSLERDTRFKPEDRKFLIEQWRKIKDETERASGELGLARQEFAGLLRTLQANEDFIDELVQIRQANKAIEVIRQLTTQIRDASGKLKTLIGSIRAPGS